MNYLARMKKSMAVKGSVSASWDIGLPEGEFLIEFEHGTTSGKRILRVNGQVGIFPHYLIIRFFIGIFCGEERMILLVSLTILWLRVLVLIHV